MSYSTISEKTLVTNNATPVVDFTVPMLTNDISYIEVTFIGSTANGAATTVGKKGGFFKNVAGTASAIGTVTSIILTTSDVALSTSSVTITPNGANAIITITGVAATTITWQYAISVFRKAI